MSVKRSIALLVPSMKKALADAREVITPAVAAGASPVTCDCVVATSAVRSGLLDASSAS